MRKMSVKSELSFFEKLFLLFDQLKEVRLLPLINNHDYTSNKINLCYDEGGKSSSFIIEYSPSCLEMYGTEQVPPELVDALSHALSGAKHQQYNLCTHYWSGKVIDDYFFQNTKP